MAGALNAACMCQARPSEVHTSSVRDLMSPKSLRKRDASASDYTSSLLTASTRSYI